MDVLQLRALHCLEGVIVSFQMITEVFAENWGYSYAKRRVFSRKKEELSNHGLLGRPNTWVCGDWSDDHIWGEHCEL